MAIFPRVQSPCPYKSRLAEIMDGDVCRMCKREVFELTGMSDGERLSFLAACSGEVCVSYRFPLRPAVAAAVAAAAIVTPTAAAAQEEMMIIVGGIADPSHAEMIDTAQDEALPELPVAYEEEPAAKPDKPAADAAADEVSSPSGS
jgi:predicted Fe-S protein YdhL (DUF1289 family)